MNSLSTRSLRAIIAGSALLGSFALAGTALAAGPSGFIHNGQNMPRPAITGTVASISGTTLTVTAKNWQRQNTTTASTTYTVDATSATVTKGSATSTVSAILVGDTVMIKGTVTGTNVVATTIRVGAIGRSGKMSELTEKTKTTPHTPIVAGNGQPVVGGNVTAISGNSVTIVNSSNVTYTIDVTTAKVMKKGVTTATLSNITVGDSVIVQGTVNGTSVTAVSVLDQGTLPSSSDTSNTAKPATHGGFMGAIGGFFSHMFGFF